MVLQKVLKKARGDGIAEVFMWASSPTGDESPDLFWISLDVLTDGNDCLPTRILGALWGWSSRQECVGVTNQLQ